MDMNMDMNMNKTMDMNKTTDENIATPQMRILMFLGTNFSFILVAIMMSIFFIILFFKICVRVSRI